MFSVFYVEQEICSCANHEVAEAKVDGCQVLDARTYFVEDFPQIRHRVRVRVLQYGVERILEVAYNSWASVLFLHAVERSVETTRVRAWLDDASSSHSFDFSVDYFLVSVLDLVLLAAG